MMDEAAEAPSDAPHRDPPASLVDRVGAVLLAVAAALVGLLAPLFFLEAAPELFGDSVLFRVVGFAVAPLLALATLATHGDWRERTVLAATVAASTTLSFWLPEAVGLLVMAAAALCLVLLLHAAPVRTVATLFSMAAGTAAVAPLSSSLALSLLLVALLLPLAAWLPHSDRAARARVLVAAAVVSLVVLSVALADAAQGVVEAPVLFLAPLVAAAAFWLLRRPVPS